MCRKCGMENALLTDKKCWNCGLAIGEMPESSGSESGLSVTIVPHPKGFLMRLEHDGACMTLNRDEAFDLYEKLSEKIGLMPAKL